MQLLPALPAGACDCHVHVFGPFDQFPLAPERSYTPGPASVQDLLSLHRRLGLERAVVVQASPQGTDPAALVHALQRLQALGHASRGVAVVPAHCAPKTLRQLHQAGVRGLRVNLESAGQHDPAQALALLWQGARLAEPMGWHVQTYTTLDVLAAITPSLHQLPVPLVVDHLGRARAEKGLHQTGFAQLLELVAAGKVWVKLSALQRCSDAADCADAKPLVRALINACPGHMLWGSDWPHTGAWPGQPRSPHRIEAFHPVDDIRALNRLAEWTSGEEWQQILSTNPQVLYGF